MNSPKPTLFSALLMSALTISLALPLARAYAAEKAAEGFQNECVRGQPEPIVDGSYFKLAGPHSAIEFLELDEQTSVVVRHWGCETYAQRVTFLTANAEAGANDLQYWRSRAASMVTSLAQRATDAVELELMSRALEGKGNAEGPLIFGDAVQISEMETLSVTVTEIAPDLVVVSLLFVVAL